MKNLSQQVTDSIPEFFFIWSIPEKKIIYLSDYTDQIQNISIYNFDRFRNLIDKEEFSRLDEVFLNINEGRYYQDQDFQANFTNRVKYYNLKTYPIRDNGKITKVAGHVIDITRRKEKEEMTKRENQQLEDILHILAHDLRGPLGNIINLAKLQTKTDSLESIRSFSEIIVRIGYDTTRLINSMIELIQLDSKDIPLDLANCKFNSWLKASISPYQNEISEKNITLNFDLPAEEVDVSIDLSKFQLIIQNLLSNAIKFTREGGVIDVKLRKETQLIRFSIKDNGIGIPLDQRDHLFEKFSPARRKGIRGEKSTGLGLAIVKQIVDLHDGQIEVISEEGNGSEFVITLPVNLIFSSQDQKAGKLL